MARLSNAYKVIVRGSDVPTPQKYSLVVTGPGLVLASTTGGACPQPEPFPSAAPAAASADSSSVPLATFQASLGVLIAAVIVLAIVAGTFWRRASKNEGGARAPLINNYSTA
jgi:hypothetical protein